MFRLNVVIQFCENKKILVLAKKTDTIAHIKTIIIDILKDLNWRHDTDYLELFNNQNSLILDNYPVSVALDNNDIIFCSLPLKNKCLPETKNIPLPQNAFYHKVDIVKDSQLHLIPAESSSQAGNESDTSNKSIEIPTKKSFKQLFDQETDLNNHPSVYISENSSDNEVVIENGVTEKEQLNNSDMLSENEDNSHDVDEPVIHSSDDENSIKKYHISSPQTFSIRKAAVIDEGEESENDELPNISEPESSDQEDVESVKDPSESIVDNDSDTADFVLDNDISPIDGEDTILSNTESESIADIVIVNTVSPIIQSNIDKEENNKLQADKVAHDSLDDITSNIKIILPKNQLPSTANKKKNNNQISENIIKVESNEIPEKTFVQRKPSVRKSFASLSEIAASFTDTINSEAAVSSEEDVKSKKRSRSPSSSSSSISSSENECKNSTVNKLKILLKSKKKKRLSSFADLAAAASSDEESTKPMTRSRKKSTIKPNKKMKKTESTDSD